MLLRMPFHRQKNDYFCGPAVLQMLFAFYGRRISQERLAREMRITKKYGILRKELVYALTRHGFVVRAKSGSTIGGITRSLRRGAPVVVNYIEPSDEEGHYAIVVGIKNKKLILNDPRNGRGFRISAEEFKRRWESEDPREARALRWMMTISGQPLANSK